MRSPVLVLLSIVVLIFALLATPTPRPESRADEPKAAKSWSHVQVVSYASGLTGFFDTRTGRYYLYDGNLDKPFLVRQIDELGKPMKKIEY
jgi:hypothetical protein